MSLANPKLVATSTNNHPRLFFDASEIPTLQAKVPTTQQGIRTPVRDYVDSHLNTAPPTLEEPARVSIVAEYRLKL